MSDLKSYLGTYIKVPLVDGFRTITIRSCSNTVCSRYAKEQAQGANYCNKCGSPVKSVDSQVASTVGYTGSDLAKESVDLVTPLSRDVIGDAGVEYLIPNAHVGGNFNIDEYSAGEYVIDANTIEEEKKIFLHNYGDFSAKVLATFPGASIHFGLLTYWY